ncbi:MAG: SufE family protein [Sandaracinaceae bacterium]|jgi:cysteine desulfuration protein SufE|nr:SufE family protein [Sandaracinaceae bacterium]MBK7777070.1 SufE family protein [Sandaracinaceae bacterium]MBK8589748.1 SufE family protein [Sandaracinaceae bacterium]
MHNPVGVSLPELLENFEFLDDWMERYRYIIELGKRLPEMPEALRTPENKVLGCQSQVWLVVAESDDPERIVFEADSDAHIVRGLVAILLVMFSGKTRDEIRALDPRPTFAELGLDQHLSQGRSNGLLSMVGRIKALAAA